MFLSSKNLIKYERNSVFMSITKQFNQGISFGTWVKLLFQNIFRIHPKYWLRAIYITFISFMTLPLQIIERIFFHKKIINTEVKAPIFIIGHWRSGTTYLHNIFSIDKNYGFCSTLFAGIPSYYIVGNKLMRWGASKLLWDRRPADNVVLHVDFPQEEEYALANISTNAFYHKTVFPNNKYRYSVYATEEWKKDYIYLLKKLTFINKGKQLVLKNPVNTARIRVLLEMFPDAKFIHMHRYPSDVIGSTMNLYSKLLPHFLLQEPKRELEDEIFDIYYKLLKEFKRTWHLIPNENLVTIDFKDLVHTPHATLAEIYKKFNLKYTYSREQSLYILSQKGHKITEHNLTADQRKRVRKICSKLPSHE